MKTNKFTFPNLAGIRQRSIPRIINDNGNMRLVMGCLFFAVNIILLSCTKKATNGIEPLAQNRMALATTKIPSANTISIFSGISFFSQWGGDDKDMGPAPTGITRIGRTAYVRMLTAAERAKIGSTLTFNFSLKKGCDPMDRIGTLGLIRTPAGKPYNDAAAEAVEAFRFMTPFTDPNTPETTPYSINADQLAPFFGDSTKDIYVMAAIGGYSMFPANAMYNPLRPEQNASAKGCTSSKELLVTFYGSLELQSNNTKPAGNVKLFTPFSNPIPLGGELSLSNFPTTGELTGSFTQEADSKATVLYVITTGHGSKEEFKVRTHTVTLDGKTKYTINPSQVCTDYKQNNTSYNTIYLYYSPSNPRSWCPGAPSPVYPINLGALTKGAHTIKISIAGTGITIANGNNYNLTSYLSATY